MRDASVQTESTILFVADVGEEGEGNLRGMRKLVETYGSQLRFVIALDGSTTDYVSNAALASRRVEVTLSGPGGHSWSDFGAPNPIHALARGVARFVKTPVPDSPRTSFNVGSIEGGTSVNSIPARAAIKVDLRSESESELGRLESALRREIQAGLDEEMAASRRRGFYSIPALTLEFNVLGVRPGGELADDSPLLAAVRAADQFLGNRSRIERSSTDANIPLAAGMQAIALGAGGQSANAHSHRRVVRPGRTRTRPAPRPAHASRCSRRPAGLVVGENIAGSLMAERLHRNRVEFPVVGLPRRQRVEDAAVIPRNCSQRSC